MQGHKCLRRTPKRSSLSRNKHDAHGYVDLEFGLSGRKPSRGPVDAKEYDVPRQFVRSEQIAPRGIDRELTRHRTLRFHLFDLGQGTFHRIDREHTDRIWPPHIRSAESSVRFIEKVAVRMNRNFCAVIGADEI